MPAITTRATNVARTSTSAPKVPMVSIVAYDTPALAVSSNVSYSRTSSTIRVAVDPAYIEIKNYSPKAKLQLINPTKKPDATFQADAVEIAVDHVIPNADGTWTAIAKLDSAEMLASGMCPGDLVRMRQVAANGVASKESALIYVDPNLNNLPNPQAVAQELHRDTFSSKPTTSVSRRAAGRRAVDVTTTTTTRRQTDIVGFRAHTIRFDVATRNGTLPPSDFKDVAQDARFLYDAHRRGHADSITHYDGEFGESTSQYASQAIDKSKPVLVDERMTLVKTASGFELNIDRAVEPRTTLTLVNVRTKTKSSVAVGDETSAKIALPKGTLEDDDLVILVQGDDQRPHTHKDAHLTSRICRVGDDALVDMSYDDYRNACFFYNQFNDALSLPAL